MMDHYFLYLHGYQSSPTTLRALKIQLWLREHFPEARIDAPRLADQSAQAVFEYLSNMLDEVQSKRKVIIGASLGGLIAHLFKQLRHDVTDVILINPALRFDEIIKNMGLISPDEPESEVNLKDIELIRSFIPKEAHHQEDYLLLLQQDDEVCPYTWSLDLLPKAHSDIQTGQGHSYSKIETAYPSIEKFLNRK